MPQQNNSNRYHMLNTYYMSDLYLLPSIEVDTHYNYFLFSSGGNQVSARWSDLPKATLSARSQAGTQTHLSLCRPVRFLSPRCSSARLRCPGQQTEGLPESNDLVRIFWVPDRHRFSVSCRSLTKLQTGNPCIHLWSAPWLTSQGFGSIHWTTIYWVLPTENQVKMRRSKR